MRLRAAHASPWAQDDAPLTSRALRLLVFDFDETLTVRTYMPAAQPFREDDPATPAHMRGHGPSGASAICGRGLVARGHR